MFTDNKKIFLAHKEILELLDKRVSNFKNRYRQNIAIIGKEGTGKTSLLLQFLNNYSFEEGTVPIYLEFKKEDSFDYFARQFIKKLLFYFLRTKWQTPKEENFEFDFLIQQAKRYIPQTIRDILQIRDCLKDKKNDLVYSSILKLPYLLTQESGAKLIIFFDEFHCLGYFKIASPFLILAKEVIIQKDVLYILTSSSVNLAQKILSQKLSLLLGSFEVVKIEPFDFKTAGEFLRQKNEWISISPACRNFLITFTNGYPSYLTAISARIKLVAQEKRVSYISFPLLQRCLYEELFLEDGQINQLLLRRINNIKNQYFDDFIYILFSLAEGNKKITEISKKTGKKRKDVSKFLFHLIKKDIIYKNGLFYGFEDSLLKFWLNNSYRLKREDPSFNLGYAKKEFLNRIERLFSDFTSETKTDILERVKNLLKCWQNEILLIDNKKYKLPHFASVRVESLQTLIAQEKNRYWIGEIEKRRVSPKVIKEFIEKCKKVNHKHRVTRRFLIALKEVEIDAKILAKEEKIWILGLKQLNFLLDFYGRFKIIG